MSNAFLNVQKMQTLAFPASLDTSGATDCSAAINAAINTVYTDFGGGVVTLPRGTLKANVVMKPGVVLQGQGRGLNASGVTGIPQTPVYTATAGGTTLIPADTAQPVIKAAGSSGSSNWAEFTIRDLKVSSLAGSITSGTIGIQALLANEFTIQNVEVSVMDTGIQLGSNGNTAWSFKIDGCSIHDCGAYGLNVPDKSQTGVPGLVLGTDIRRCTRVGAYIRDVRTLIWIGGTIADNDYGMHVLGSITRNVGVHGVEFEANITRALLIGATSEAPQGVTMTKCGFVRYDGTPAAGSIAVEQVTGSTTTLVDCDWRGYDTAVLETGGSAIVVARYLFTQGGTFGDGITTLSAAATDAATTQSLVNEIRSLLIAHRMAA